MTRSARRRDVNPDESSSSSDQDSRHGSRKSSARASKSSHRASKRGKGDQRMSSLFSQAVPGDSDDDEPYWEPMGHHYTLAAQDANLAPNTTLLSLLQSRDADLEAANGRHGVTLDLSRMHVGHRHLLLFCTALANAGCPLSHLSLRGCHLHSTMLPVLIAALGSRGTRLTHLDLSDNPHISYMGAREILGLLRRRRRLVSVNLEGCSIHPTMLNRIATQVTANIKHMREARLGSVSGEPLSLGFHIPRSFLSVHFPPILVLFHGSDSEYVRGLCSAMAVADPRLNGAFATYHHRKTCPDYHEFVKTCFVEADYVLIVASPAWCADEQCSAEASWFQGRNVTVVFPEILDTNMLPEEAEEWSSEGEDEDMRNDDLAYHLARLSAFHTQTSSYVPQGSDPRLLTCVQLTQQAGESSLAELPVPYRLASVPLMQRHLVLVEEVGRCHGSSQEGLPASITKLADALTDDLRSSVSFVLPAKAEMAPLSKWHKAFVLVAQSLSPDNPTHISLYPTLLRRLSQHRKEGVSAPFLPEVRVVTAFEKAVDAYVQQVKEERLANSPDHHGCPDLDASTAIAKGRQRRGGGGLVRHDKESSPQGDTGNSVGRTGSNPKGRAAAPPGKPAAGGGSGGGVSLRDIFFDVDSSSRFRYSRIWREWEEDRVLSCGVSLTVPNPNKLRLRQILADEEARVARERASLICESRALRVSQRALASKVRLINRLENRVEEARASASVSLESLLPYIDDAVIREVRSLKEPRLTDNVRICAKAVLVLIDDTLDDKSRPLSWWWSAALSAFAAENQFLYKMANVTRVRKRQWARIKDFINCPAYSLDATSVPHEEWAREALDGARTRGAIALLARWVHCVFHRDRVVRHIEGDAVGYIDLLHDEYKDLQEEVTLQEQRASLLQAGVGHLQQQVGQRIRLYSTMTDGFDGEEELSHSLSKPHSAYLKALQQCALFHGVPGRVLKHIALNSEVVSFEKRSTIHPQDAALLILTGRFQMVVDVDGPTDTDGTPGETRPPTGMTDRSDDPPPDRPPSAEGRVSAGGGSQTGGLRLALPSSPAGSFARIPSCGAGGLPLNAAVATSLASPASQHNLIPRLNSCLSTASSRGSAPPSPSNAPRATRFGGLAVASEGQKISADCVGTAISLISPLTVSTRKQQFELPCSEAGGGMASPRKAASEHDSENMSQAGSIFQAQSLRGWGSMRSYQSRSLGRHTSKRLSKRSCNSFATDASEGQELTAALSSGSYLFESHLLQSLIPGYILESPVDPVRCLSLGAPRGRPVTALCITASSIPSEDHAMVSQILEANRTSAISKARKMFFLRKLPCLKRIGSEVVLCIANVAREVSFPPGSTVVTRGSDASDLFIICTGSVICEGSTLSEVFFPHPEDVLYNGVIARDVLSGGSGCQALAIASQELVRLCTTFSTLRGRINCKAGLGDEPIPQVLMSRSAAQGATNPYPWVDFNGEFQRLVHWRPRNVRQATSRREKLDKLLNAFVRTIQPTVEMIVAQLHLQGGNRTLHPAEGGSNLPLSGGQRFVINGVLFELASNKGNIHGCIGGASKYLKHELRAWEKILATGVQGITVPLCALVSFRGYRVRVTPVLPIGGRDTVVHGGADGRGPPEDDAARRKESPEISAALKGVCALLNLNGHLLRGSSSAKVHGPADLEVRRGSDGRFYILRPARLFPPKTVAPERHYQGQWLVDLMRPEAVAAAKKPLSSDAFSRWGLPADDTAVANQCRVLQHVIVPEFARDIAKMFRGHTPVRFDGDIRSPELTAALEEVCVEAHRRGVNIRSFAAVLTLLPTECPATARLLHVEVLSRSIKSVLFRRLRHVLRSSAETCEEEAARLLSEAFGKGQSNDVFWRDVLYPACKEKFGFRNLATYFQELPTLFTTAEGVDRVEYNGFTAAFTGIKAHPDVHMMLLSRVCQLCGVRLSASDVQGHYDRLTEALHNTQSSKRKERESIRSSICSNSSRRTGGGVSRVKRQEDSRPFNFLEGAVSTVRCMVLPEDDPIDTSLQRGRYDLASEQIQKKISTMTSIIGGENASLVRPLISLASVYDMLGERDAQLQSLNKALELCVRDLPFVQATGVQEHSVDEAEALVALGSFHLHWGVVGKAAYLLGCAKSVLYGLGFAPLSDVLKGCLCSLAEAEEKQLNHALAQAAYEAVRDAAASQGLPPHSRDRALPSAGIAKSLLGQFLLDEALVELDSLAAELSVEGLECDPDLLPAATEVRCQMYDLKGTQHESVVHLHGAIECAWRWVESACTQTIVKAVRSLTYFLGFLVKSSHSMRQCYSRAEELVSAALQKLPEITALFAKDPVLCETSYFQSSGVPGIDALLQVVHVVELPLYRRRLTFALCEEHFVSLRQFEKVESLRTVDLD